MIDSSFYDPWEAERITIVRVGAPKLCPTCSVRQTERIRFMRTEVVREMVVAEVMRRRAREDCDDYLDLIEDLTRER